MDACILPLHFCAKERTTQHWDGPETMFFDSSNKMMVLVLLLPNFLQNKRS
jgi:hypothetical protein